MTSNLKGLTAMITGASTGIGKAVCIALAREGCNICALGRSEERLLDTVNQCSSFGVKVLKHALNISCTQQLEDAINLCVSQLGGLNILINSAGMGGSSDTSIEYWEKCINVNLVAMMKLTKLALPHIEKGPNGAIINISSDEGRDEQEKNHAPYCAAKFGVVGFSGSLFEDVREKGIKVCSIEPEYVNTPMMSENPDFISKKLIQPEDVARAVLFVLMFGDTSCPTEIYLSCQRNPYKLDDNTEESH